ncbi:hypothetical protein Rhe02_01670 [Rhizocola hellebori]|uniref:Uncharacterized protein n=1 Tax=Rhizocola hellebori TaxID=1392758 RepID=A0A8J3Q1M2_9ACTN|nr:hypothetical protein [Rhizocola hellebori]GIH02100.1 hypothetical protein Rhe02_01670 [Rhizocola hellebori]
MLHARKPSWWTNSYDIMAGNQLITRWNRSLWRNGGTFALDGHSYTIRANAWGSKYTMTLGTDRVIAAAERVGRKNWTVQAGGHTYAFQRTSMWRQEEALVTGGRVTGVIRRVSTWRTDAVADLPQLEPAVQVFVLAVVLTMWDNAHYAASSVTIVS